MTDLADLSNWSYHLSGRLRARFCGDRMRRTGETMERGVYYYLFLGLLTLAVLVWAVVAILDQDLRD